jgi:hypothetical protein
MAIDKKAFSQDQLDRLRRLQLSDRQIEALDEFVRAFGRAWAASLPTVTETREPILELRKHLKTAMDQWSKIMDSRTAALLQAANNILVATDRRSEYSESTIFADQLRRAVQWCDDALRQLPKQRRSHAGHWLPVARIWETLVRTHDSSCPMVLKLSSSPGTPFGEICCICYEAMTGKPDVPERAIKAYASAVRRRDKAQWRNLQRRLKKDPEWKRKSDQGQKLVRELKSAQVAKGRSKSSNLGRQAKEKA